MDISAIVWVAFAVDHTLHSAIIIVRVATALIFCVVDWFCCSVIAINHAVGMRLFQGIASLALDFVLGAAGSHKCAF